jgi:hypothetical protein
MPDAADAQMLFELAVSYATILSTILRNLHCAGTPCGGACRCMRMTNGRAGMHQDTRCSRHVAALRAGVHGEQNAVRALTAGS